MHSKIKKESSKDIEVLLFFFVSLLLMLEKYIKFYTKEIEDKRVYTVLYTYLEYTIYNSPNKILISSFAGLNKYKLIMSQGVEVLTVLGCIIRGVDTLSPSFIRKILPGDDNLAISIIRSVIKGLVYRPKLFSKQSEETWNIFEKHIKAGIYLGDEYIMRYIGDTVTIERL